MVQGVDERHVVSERDRAHFVLFIYEGGDAPQTSWSVDSRLITDADLTDVLSWLPSQLPQECCWSLGVVRQPDVPTTGSDLDVVWIVGADVLNVDRGHRSPEDQSIAEAMMTRRHHVNFP